MSSTLSLCFTGDLLLSDDLVEEACRMGYAPAHALARITPALQRAEVLVVNLEGPVGSAGSPRPGATALLHNHPAVVDWLKQFPVCVCNLANNHVMDYGREALARTVQTLDHNGIHHVGAGLDQRQAEQELIINVRGRRIAFVSCTSDEPHVGSIVAAGTSPGAFGLRDSRRVLSKVDGLRNQGHHVVVSLHWGHEYFAYPSEEQVQFCRAVAEAGATIVVGHHPHVRQGFECHKSAPILYSLGNLLLPPIRMSNGRIQRSKRGTREFLLAELEIDGASRASCRFLGGALARDRQLTLHNDRKQVLVQTRLAEISAPLRRAGYADFWSAYQRRRSRELEREALVEAMWKLIAAACSGSLSSLTMADLRRNLGRLFSCIHRGRVAARSGLK